MAFVSIDLTFMTHLDVAVAINLHGHRIVTDPQAFLHHGVSTGMCPKGAFMYFHYNLVFFLLVQTSKQNQIIIPFV